VDQYSWGFRRNAVLTDYLSVGYFVGMLAETVSCGGNMLLNVGPNKDGMIDAIFADRLTGSVQHPSNRRRCTGYY
jgi:alpha-L-fucosidase